LASHRFVFSTPPESIRTQSALCVFCAFLRPEAPAASLNRKKKKTTINDCDDDGRTLSKQQQEEEQQQSMALKLDGAIFSWAAPPDASAEYKPSLQRAARILAPKKKEAAADVKKPVAVEDDGAEAADSDPLLQAAGHGGGGGGGSDDAAAAAFAVGPLALALPSGGIVGVVGPVGCGKSTFIMGLLGELRNQQQQQQQQSQRAPGGSLEEEEGVPVPGGVTAAAACGGDAPVGYLSQTPAVVNGSLRQNVTLGMPCDAERCAFSILKTDQFTKTGSGQT
jgi:hypothetical protein